MALGEKGNGLLLTDALRDRWAASRVETVTQGSENPRLGLRRKPAAGSANRFKELLASARRYADYHGVGESGMPQTPVGPA